MRVCACVCFCNRRPHRLTDRELIRYPDGFRPEKAIAEIFFFDITNSFLFIFFAIICPLKLEYLIFIVVTHQNIVALCMGFNQIGEILARGRCFSKLNFCSTRSSGDI